MEQVLLILSQNKKIQLHITKGPGSYFSSMAETDLSNKLESLTTNILEMWKQALYFLIMEYAWIKPIKDSYLIDLSTISGFAKGAVSPILNSINK